MLYTRSVTSADSDVRKTSARRWVVLALIGLLALGELPNSVAFASPISFRIPAGSAEEALSRFGLQSGIQMLFSHEAVAGESADEVIGQYEPRDALQKLLIHSRLTYRFVNERTVAIRREVANGAGRPEHSPDIKSQRADPPASFRLAQRDEMTAVQRPTSRAEEAPQAPAVVPDAQEVVVTGTRIVRDGYDAPTPTTVLDASALLRTAPLNIADAVNQLPALAATASPRNGNTGGVSIGNGGANNMNLRGIGVSRTLVLLDGARIAPQGLSGAPDINAIPDGLMKRVDVVTGGASAAYGSDAVAGVVNFVLNTTYSGLKAELLGGGSTHGDDGQYKVSVTGGLPFAGDRGHFVFGADFADNNAVRVTDRSWYQGWKEMTNPAYVAGNGQPQLLIEPNVGLTNAAPGFLVSSGPLRGLEFYNNGQTRQLTFGSLVANPLMSGGDWQRTDIGNRPDLGIDLSQFASLGRLSFDVAERAQVFVQATRSRSVSDSHTSAQFNLGNLTIQRDNAFLPAAVGAQMDSLGLHTLTGGSTNIDLDDGGSIPARTVREVESYQLGTKGTLDIAGKSWKWDAYVQRGWNTTHNDALVANNANYLRAIDAVLDPVTNQPVCRSTLTNPGNGCVPYDILGTGNKSAAGYAYVFGNPWQIVKVVQGVGSASVQGEPVATWAGPVSIAAGGEWRQESVRTHANPLGLTNTFFAANYKETNGKYDVSEEFLETLVPLAANLPGARSLDLNAAVRFTNYSTSGGVTTWKVGMTYSPLEDITFRGTRSRDIRAPNLLELYQAGQTGSAPVIDPVTGLSTAAIRNTTIGNLNLRPEVADTKGLGFVFRPSLLPGFNLAVDYYNIDLKGAIATLTAQQIVDQCFAGSVALCADVSRDAAGNIAQITVQPVNSVKQTAEGIDIETSYQRPLWVGNLTLRGLVSDAISRKSDNGYFVTQLAGVNTFNAVSAGVNTIAGTPRWRWLGEATYAFEPFSVTLTGRGLSSGLISNEYVQCSSACPLSNSINQTINNNHVSGAFYVDLAVSYRMLRDSSAFKNLEVFVKVDNLADKDPPVAGSPALSSSFLDTGVNPVWYDTLGRIVRAGVRVEW